MDAYVYFKSLENEFQPVSYLIVKFCPDQRFGGNGVCVFDSRSNPVFHHCVVLILAVQLLNKSFFKPVHITLSLNCRHTEPTLQDKNINGT